MSNYPPGAENDPRAPYNQKEEKMPEWEADTMAACKKCDKEYVEVNDYKVCEECFTGDD